MNIHSIRNPLPYYNFHVAELAVRQSRRETMLWCLLLLKDLEIRRESQRVPFGPHYAN